MGIAEERESGRNENRKLAAKICDLAPSDSRLLKQPFCIGSGDGSKFFYSYILYFG